MPEVIQYHERFLTTGHRHHQNRLSYPEHHSRHRQMVNCQHLPADNEKLHFFNFGFIMHRHFHHQRPDDH